MTSFADKFIRKNMAEPKVAASSVEEMKIPTDDLTEIIEEYVRRTTGRDVMITKHNIHLRQEGEDGFVVVKWTNSYHNK